MSMGQILPATHSRRHRYLFELPRLANPVSDDNTMPPVWNLPYGLLVFGELLSEVHEDFIYSTLLPPQSFTPNHPTLVSPTVLV